MSLSYQNPNPSNSSAKKPVRWRLIAILIMVAGAIGFAIGLLVFDQQISCLALSTLVTLAGLGLNITARRKGWTGEREKGEVEDSRSAAAARWLRRSRAPRGLRGSGAPVQAPMAVPPSAVKKTVTFGSIPGALPERVIAILEAQGARVTIESRAEGRGILGITTREGQRFIVMILEGGSPVDVRDVRSLLALIRGSGSVRGYLISSGRISQPAYQWALGRPQIRLVQDDELDELSI